MLQFANRDCPVTRFEQSEDSVWLERLFGVTCNFCGKNEAPLRLRGLLNLSLDHQVILASDWRLTDSQARENEIQLAWQTADNRLEWKSLWNLHPDTGVCRRQDILTNKSPNPVTIQRALARFTFTPEDYEIYCQRSTWNNENQGAWLTLDRGTLLLHSEAGRTCQSATPYMAMRPVHSSRGIAFHILPCGNWIIKASRSAAMPGGQTKPFLVLEAGLADHNLHLALDPGRSLSLPEILIQSLPDSTAESAAPRLHQHLLHHVLPKRSALPPVIYNTWLHHFDRFTPELLREQIAAAKEVGCEAFVIDAGWYGGDSQAWEKQTGNWLENTKIAFQGNMKRFAEEVRAAGMGFGLWMEPEAVNPDAPICREHPEWLIPSLSGRFYPDLQNPGMYHHIRSEMIRLIETYQLVWMKIDFNQEIGPDPYHQECYGYYQAWYRLLDEIKQQYPALFLESSASGGMRSDIRTLCHFDGHFISDTAESIDVLRIYQGALLRLPPGRILKWATVRAWQSNTPFYAPNQDPDPNALLVPSGATWGQAFPYPLDFILRANFTGVLGFSGDLASLPAEQRTRIGEHVQFYKQWRAFIYHASAHLLTPPEASSVRNGWPAFQFQGPDLNTSLIFAYRLDPYSDAKILYPRNLLPDANYNVVNPDSANEPAVLLSGKQLMHQGLTICLPQKFSAAIRILQAE